MDPKLSSRRQAAADRHDLALARWPDRNHPEFITELEAVVSELKEVAEKSDEAGEGRAERSRSWTFLGMAYFDLGLAYTKVDRDLGTESLTQSAIAYDRAERLLLGIGDPIQAAKLNFNYGNTLRGLSEGEDVKLLGAAKERYQLALETFQSESPQYAMQVSNALATLEHQLTLAKLTAAVEEKVSRFEELQQRLHQAGPQPSPQEGEKIRRELERIREEGPDLSDVMETVNREVQGLLKDLKQPVPEASAAAIGEQLDRIRKVFEQMSPPETEDETDFEAKVFSMLMERYEREVQAGKVSPMRQRALKPTLDELRELCNKKPDDIGEIADWAARMRARMKTMVYTLAQPSIGKPEPPSGSRASKILALWSTTKTNLVTELNQPHLGSDESKRGNELMIRCGEAEQAIYDSEADDTNALEAELLRPLALEVRGFALRNHIMFADPYWGAAPVTIDPNSAFFSGGAYAEQILREICKKRGLRLLSTATGVNIAQSRWNQLGSGNVAVFDLTVEPGPDLAAVCYELGIARSLGKPVMIVTDMERSLPFDVDVKPVTLRGAEKKDLQSCADALDRAMFIGPQSPWDSSVEDTIAYAQQYYGSGGYGPQIKQALDLLDDAKGDAVLAQRRLNTLLGFLSSDITMILYPAWRPHYSKPGKPACFHVMPFSEPWSNRVSDLARQACDEANISYVRGDLVSDPNIIRSIWEEICKASHVLVDLTGFNPNVALELGIAHTLGRKTLIMGQPRTVKRLFPLIAKTRFDTYHLKDGGQSALEIVLRFVKS